jgi:hypothetical protein
LLSLSSRISRLSKSAATERSCSVVVRAAKPVPEIHELVDRCLVICHQDEGARKSFAGLTPKRTELNQVDNTARNSLERQLRQVAPADARNVLSHTIPHGGCDATPWVGAGCGGASHACVRHLRA